MAEKTEGRERIERALAQITERMECRGGHGTEDNCPRCIATKELRAALAHQHQEGTGVGEAGPKYPPAERLVESLRWAIGFIDNPKKRRTRQFDPDNGGSGEEYDDWLEWSCAHDWLKDAKMATTPEPQQEEGDCERCKNTGHDWEPGPTGEPISTGPCPDCFHREPKVRVALPDAEPQWMTGEEVAALIRTIALANARLATQQQEEDGEAAVQRARAFRAAVQGAREKIEEATAITPDSPEKLKAYSDLVEEAWERLQISDAGGPMCSDCGDPGCPGEDGSSLVPATGQEVDGVGEAAEAKARADLAKLKGEIRYYAHHERKAEEQLDLAGVEKFDDEDRDDSTDDSAGQPWAIWVRIKFLRRRAERAEKRVAELEAATSPSEQGGEEAE